MTAPSTRETQTTAIDCFKRDSLEKTIENRHLEEEILEVRVPMPDVVEMKNGAKKTVQKKLFPGYVLINMIMNDDTWYVVRNTRGVTGLKYFRF